MANFEPIIQWLLYQEDDKRTPGKIVDLHDGGGLTRLGLTQKWHKHMLPENFFTTMGFSDAVKAAKVAYEDEYWYAIKGDLILSDDVAAALLSFSVNDTTRVAVKTLQFVLGIDQDGYFGTGTLGELNSKDPAVVAKLFRAEWIDFYKQLVSLNPMKAQFLDGWINRANFPYPSPLVPTIYES